MNPPAIGSARPRLLLYVLATAALAAAAFGLVQYGAAQPRGGALGAALQPLIAQQGSDASLVATALWENYEETRANTARWSTVYWGMTFLAAVLSALAGVILKFELVIRSEPLKKDLAALFSVAAALLITISSGGDFHRKWQANRIAAADLERAGYELLSKNAADPRAYFAEMSRILHTRQVSIVGDTDPKAAGGNVEGASSKQK